MCGVHADVLMDVLMGVLMGVPMIVGRARCSPGSRLRSEHSQRWDV